MRGSTNTHHKEPGFRMRAMIVLREGQPASTPWQEAALIKLERQVLHHWKDEDA